MGSFIDSAEGQRMTNRHGYRRQISISTRATSPTAIKISEQGVACVSHGAGGLTLSMA